MKRSTGQSRRIPGQVAAFTDVQAPLAEKGTRHEICPIIGIGSSAGGLEALEQFLRNVPPHCGLAFVIVQHLDPTHNGIMVELLQRSTTMPVAEVTDRMTIEADHVYLIPPNKDLSLLHGVLHLLAPAAPRGLRLPIDFFFRSLAEDQQVRSIGVILSGMASDGTLGLRAIKEKAGAAFVQAPTSAKFDGMPRSAIDAGLADVIAPADELPEKIIAYIQHISPRLNPKAELRDTEQSGLDKVVILLRARTGQDFSHYKKSTIYRRIERRMGLHQLAKIDDYVRYLQENSQETHLLFNELLIGITRFFRDPEVWETLKHDAIPKLLAAHPDGAALRAWTPGCSTGEEAYTLAMIFCEAQEALKPKANFTLQIFATDLDHDAIQKARSGIYPANILADVSEDRLQRFFVQEEDGFRVSKAIREMVTFAPQNLIMDPPFTKLDILTCRNLLIYLTPEIQKKVIPLFHYSLNAGGILLLGTSETIGSDTNLFAALPGKCRIYWRSDTRQRAESLEFPTTFARFNQIPDVSASATRNKLSSTTNLETLAEQLLLQQYSPAAVLVTDHGDILYISGKTGRYLEPVAGKANWNVLVMARTGLKNSLGDAFQRAVRNRENIVLKQVRIGVNGSTQIVDVTIQPLAEPEMLRGTVLIVFKDLPAPSARRTSGKADRTSTDISEVSDLHREILRLQQEQQTAREEMQTSQEELRSSNEELQSTNEELQSTNEELTTSKEEMQSMNEELQTVNHELQSKVEELSQASNDMKNLLNSTDIAILFLDDALRVRRFTSQTVKIIKLIATDAGRPITDLVTTLENATLEEDARNVLRTLAYCEKQVPSRDGQWFSVRIMPYRTIDNRIDGVVITFFDITRMKQLEAELRAVQVMQEARFTQQTVELGRITEQLQLHSQTDLPTREDST